MALDVDESIPKPDLSLDPVAPEGRRDRQGRNLVERACELRHGLDQRRARQRLLARFAPKAGGLLDQPGLGAMTCQQFRLALGDLRKSGLKHFGNTGVKGASGFAQQRSVGRILHQSMLEQVGRIAVRRPVGTAGRR